MNIHPFEWPQHLDSGIDLVGFATLNRKSGDNRGDATAFVAGFQARGTDEYFTEEQKRSVQIAQHEDYWKTATLPVFVARISNDGAALFVEDAMSSLHGLTLIPPSAERAKSIATTVTIQSAATDIRLRMFAHALAPWISQRLRARPLAHEDKTLGLDRSSAWSLLDYTAGRYSSFPVPGAWTDLHQYFTLVDYLYDDWDFRNQLFQDLRNRVSKGDDNSGYGWDDDFDYPGAETSVSRSDAGAFRLLAGMVELLLRFESLLPSLTASPMHYVGTQKALQARIAELRANDTTENFHAIRLAEEARYYPKEALARNHVEDAIRVITEVWSGAANALECSPSGLVDKIYRFSGWSSPKATGALERISKGDTLKALRETIRPWASNTFYVGHWN